MPANRYRAPPMTLASGSRHAPPEGVPNDGTHREGMGQMG